MVAERSIFVPVFDIHAGDEHALGHGSLAGAGDLEALARVRRETVQIQAVVPVRPADKGQAVRAEMGAGVVKAPAQMLHQGLRFGGIVIKGYGFVQDRPVAGLPQVGGGSRNEPERVIVEAAAHIPVALFRQGLILVVGAAVLKLGGGNIQDAFPRTGGDHVDKAQQILTGIPETHAAADAAFVVAGAAAHVEGHHALILVPQAHHPVQLFLAGGQLPAGQQLLPVIGQRFAGGIHLRIRGVARHHGLGPCLVEDAGRCKLFCLRVFDVTQPEDDALLLARGQCKVEVVGTHRCPAMGDAAGAVPGQYGLRCGRAAIHAAESVSAGIKAGNGGVGPEHGVVIAALPVFGLVVDGAALHLYFAGGKVALEVGAVVHGIPQAKLHIAEYIQRFRGGCPVRQGQPVDLAGIAPGDKQLLHRRNAVFLAFQDGVAQAMAAGIGIQLRFGGLPARVPDGAAILDIDAMPILIQGGVIVTVAGEPAQPGIPVKAVAAAGIGHQTEKILTAQIVDPGQGRAGRIDHIFPACIFKMSVFHSLVPPLWKTENAGILNLRKRFRNCGPKAGRELVTLIIDYPAVKSKHSAEIYNRWIPAAAGLQTTPETKLLSNGNEM